MPTAPSSKSGNTTRLPRARPASGGRTPVCVITSGSLPPGLAFQSDGCIIKGTPTAAGSWGGTMSMSVAGYKGSLSSSFGVTVLGPELRAATDPSPRPVSPGR